MENSKINIWVEGNESKFFEDYLMHIELKERANFNDARGKDQIFSQAKLKTLNRQDNIVLIFDADNENVEERKKSILKRIAEENNKFGYSIVVKDIFLMPNDSDNGEFENLLFEIMNPKYRNDIFECFDGYLSCIKEKDYCPKDEKQINKTKVYIYNEALDFEHKEIYNPKKTDYTNTDHWNLNHDYLNPLLRFLKKYIS